MNHKVSVVIPVYNVENYLKRCVESVLSQTFSDYEVVLVDDGSTDQSSTICDTYEKKYDFIRVIHKENAGLSYARNEGIKNANGKYLFFLDSDDYIVPECLQILYENAIRYNADISCGSFAIFDDNNPVKRTSNDNNVYYCEGKEACIQLLYGKRFYTSSCNILLKREIPKANPFPNGKFHEDEMTTFRYFLMTSRVVITDKITYYYYQREGSIMHSFGQPVIDELLSASYYVEYCNNLDEGLTRAALFKKYYLYHHTIANFPQLQAVDEELYNKVLKYLKKNAINIILDRNASAKSRLMALKYII